MRAVFAALAALVIVNATAPNATAQQRAWALFGDETEPTSGAPAAIGSYARGCGAGFEELPQTGPTWQAMRLSRDRNWGLPETINFIESLSRYAATLPGWKGLYVGDISQPRGGPSKSGHLSHQIGLDVDIWYTPPQRLNLSYSEREKLSAISVRTKDMKHLNGNWTPQHAALLEHAAQDPRVDRIFVTAPIKISMCRTAKSSDAWWLRKLRPLYGHDDHFHVRLKCPKGSSTCVTQRPTVKALSKGGDGCDATLQWWVTGYIDQLHRPKPKPKPGAPKPKPKKNARTYVLSDLPKQCAVVLSSN